MSIALQLALRWCQAPAVLSCGAHHVHVSVPLRVSDTCTSLGSKEYGKARHETVLHL